MKLTVPVGEVGVPGSTSLAEAVQALGLFTGTEAGVQLTLVEVEW